MTGPGPGAGAARTTRATRASALIAAALVLSVLAVAAAREASIGRSELAAANVATGRADWPAAIAHARAAAEAVAPGSSCPEEGLRRLEAIGHDAAARGDEETALLAYGAMRTAALATQSPWSSRGPWRARAEEGLAKVAAALSAADPTGPRERAGSPAEAMKSALERAR
jgi:hypothetical protein